LAFKNCFVFPLVVAFVLCLVWEVLLMLKEHKKYWLLPLILAVLLAGLLVILGSTGAAPFIYTLF
jgi:hypothetical protein